MRPRVVIETPFKGGATDAIRYLAWCLYDSIVNYGEAPFASHAIYPLALSESDSDRETGLEMRDCWADVAHYRVRYTDFGVSPGMLRNGARNATAKHRNRTLPLDLFRKYMAGSWPSKAQWLSSNH